MKWTVSESLAAQVIGRTAMECINRKALVEEVNTAALELLEEIQEILNDGRMDDPECFYRIDAIVSAFHRQNVDVSRHDFG